MYLFFGVILLGLGYGCAARFAIVSESSLQKFLNLDLYITKKYIIIQLQNFAQEELVGNHIQLSAAAMVASSQSIFVHI